MKAGRELDALVAEKVMGWHRNENGCWQDGDEPARNIFGREYPKYSTEIKDAWSVVEKLTAIGNGYFTLRWIPSMQCWQAIIDVTVPKERTDGPYCRTAQEAICLAALKAVGQGRVGE